MRERRLDVSMVAKRCHVTPTTVRRWIRAGRLLAERSSPGRYAVTLSAYFAFLDASTKQTNKTNITPSTLTASGAS